LAAVLSRWISLPPVPPLVDAAEPYLVEQTGLENLRSYLSSAGAKLVYVDLTAANDATDVVGALKASLPFPDWCGSSWDSIEDAFEEIRLLWSFPLALIAQGLKSLIERSPHLAMEVVLRMSSLSHAFSVAGDQLLVTYIDDGWK
jgi:hypothetical protein